VPSPMTGIASPVDGIGRDNIGLADIVIALPGSRCRTLAAFGRVQHYLIERAGTRSR
jgi:hypothetical protein